MSALNSGKGGAAVSVAAAAAAAAAEDDDEEGDDEEEEEEEDASPSGASWPSDAPALAAYTSPAGESARAARSAAAGEVARLEGEASRLRDEAAHDFGPDAAFYKLKGTCIEARVNSQYTYSVCPFGAAKQDSTSLGSFSGWRAGDNATADHRVMFFTGGAHCWNGPARSMTATFECGEKEELFAVDEPEKCAYSCRISTPAACDATFARALRLELDDAAHDEL